MTVIEELSKEHINLYAFSLTFSRAPSKKAMYEMLLSEHYTTIAVNASKRFASRQKRAYKKLLKEYTPTSNLDFLS